MVDALADLIPSFRGMHNRVRCFLHILNLIAHMILARFEDDADDDAIDELSDALGDLMAGLDLDGRSDGSESEDPEDAQEDAIEQVELQSWVDEQTGLSDEERDSLKAAMGPISRLLKKVSISHCG